MLSNACKYSISSILYLAMYAKNERVGVKKIAKELNLPQPFLSKLLQELTKHKLVSSSKGPSGGFYLNKKDRKNRIWDVIVHVDGTDKFDNCFMGLSSCNELNPCAIHSLFAPFKQKLMKDFKEKTIEDFVSEAKVNGKSFSINGFDADNI